MSSTKLAVVKPGKVIFVYFLMNLGSFFDSRSLYYNKLLGQLHQSEKGYYEKKGRRMSN